jgi:hypothetical protein
MSNARKLQSDFVMVDFGDNREGECHLNKQQGWMPFFDKIDGKKRSKKRLRMNQSC